MCRLLNIDRPFGRVQCLHFQGQGVKEDYLTPKKHYADYKRRQPFTSRQIPTLPKK